MASQRKPAFDLDFSSGREGETYVQELIGGSRTIEVKTDRRAIDTGNLYIEYMCKGANGWYPSGIMESLSDYYAFVLRSGTSVDNNIVILIPSGVLKDYVKKCIETRLNLKELSRGSHPTRGVVLPISELLGLARS